MERELLSCFIKNIFYKINTDILPFRATFSLSYNNPCIILFVTNADTELCRYSKAADNPEAVANAKGRY